MGERMMTHFVNDDCPGGHRDECHGCGGPSESGHPLCGLCELVRVSEDAGLYDIDH